MNESTQNLAEKIARLLQAEMQSTDLHSLQSSLEKINQRLDRIESQIAIPNSKSFHPSQEKFADLKELADEIINASQIEKACPYEPNGKPCDHCSMCSARGF